MPIVTCFFLKSEAYKFMRIDFRVIQLSLLLAVRKHSVAL